MSFDDFKSFKCDVGNSFKIARQPTMLPLLWDLYIKHVWLKGNSFCSHLPTVKVSALSQEMICVSHGWNDAGDVPDETSIVDQPVPSEQVAAGEAVTPAILLKLHFRDISSYFRELSCSTVADCTQCRLFLTSWNIHTEYWLSGN